MRPINGYDEAKAYGEFEQLPRGGYVCRIVGSIDPETRRPEMDINIHVYNGREVIVLAIDIHDGEYAGYFRRQYEHNNKKKWPCQYWVNIPTGDGSEQDEWSMRKFKTLTTSLEESNRNYKWDWDEKKWKGKIFGGVFNYREYQNMLGGVSSSPNLCQVRSVETALAGDLKIPEDKKLDDQAGAPTMSSYNPDPAHFAAAEADIPF